MKICFLADGTSHHTQRWVDYFAKKGHQCHLISLEKDIKTKATEHILKSYCPINALKYILVVPRIKRILKEIAPDILNAHFASAYGFTGALTKFRPLIVSCWGSDILISPKKTFLHKLRVKWALKKADLVTSDGEDLSNVIEELGAIRERIVNSPMGIDPEILKEKERGKSAGEKITILSARKLEPLYDQKTLILAASEVMKSQKEKVRFIILGKGSQKEKLIELSQNLGINKSLEFKGFVPRQEFWDYFKKADIYISTSLSDSTSVALLEAMASGLIPIVTDIPGNREWIKESQNGFLFPPKDYRALAEKITFSIENFDEMDKIRQSNLAIIKKKALWEDNMREIEKRFSELTKSY